MEANTMRCRECKGEMKLGALDAIAGEAQSVRVKIEGMPAMQCAEGHKRFVAPDFAVRLMHALLADNQLVALDAAREKGLLRKRYCCPKCGQELGSASAASVQVKRQLELPGLNPFGVQVEVPKLRCASCNAEAIPPEKTVVDGLMKASASAFRSAGVSPT